jgi:amidase
VRTLIELTTLACSQSASRFGVADYARALQTVQSVAKSLGEFFERYDILLTPTLASPPLALGEISMSNENWADYLRQLLDGIPFTPLFNATGAPAASVPLGHTKDGAPIGVHIGARYGAESTLLQLALAMEQAAPWHNRI